MTSNQSSFLCSFSFFFAIIFQCFGVSDVFSQASSDAPQLERIKYNNHGLTVDLGVGLWAWPIPMDVNGDGFTDLVVGCSDKPYNGTYVFEHPGTKDKMPVFKKVKRLSRGIVNMQVSYVDGKPRVLTPGNEYPDFINTGLENPVKLPLPANVHPNRVRGNMWKYVDYDGDGKTDLMIGVGDWTEYGWDNAYDEKGNWKNGPIRGFIYVAKNIGTNEKPEYETPFLLKDVDGNNLETYGWPCPNMVDWDGDDDLDLLCGEFIDSFIYFQNIGSRTEPKWAKGVKITTGDGKPLTMDLQMITPVAFDWTGNGLYDIICGDEDGRVALIENSGRFAIAAGSSNKGDSSTEELKSPIFLPPKYFQQEADEVKCGALSTPFAVDWDGDGDWDIICGNTAGYILFYENLSGPGVDPPIWAAPQYLCTDIDGESKPIRILAGPNGSIQGPCEAKWGYTVLTVADWDGDGLLDIMINSIWGKIEWYKNIGTKNKPKLAAAQAVEVQWDGPQPQLAYGWLRPDGPNDHRLLTQWRTTPIMFDWNRDGLTDLLMLDHEGFFCFFERKKVGDELVLLPPRRVFLDVNGQPLQLNQKIGGGSGRRKICVVDYDGDGAVDFLVNSINADVFRQVKHDNRTWTFQSMGPVDGRNISSHSTSPTTVDFDGNGIPDLLIGAEDGYLYYKKNPRSFGAKDPWYIKWSKYETDAFALEFADCAIKEFKNGAISFGNRDYVWQNIPKEFQSGKERPIFFTQIQGGTPPYINITAKKDATLFMTTGSETIGAPWQIVQKDAFNYSDGGKTKMSIFSKPMKKDEYFQVPQSQWTGCALILVE